MRGVQDKILVLAASALVLWSSLGLLKRVYCCVVEFVIDDLQSNVALSSEVVRPFPVTFSTANSEFVSEGLRGSLYVDLAPGPCPEVAPTGADLLNALGRGATLKSTPTSLPGTSTATSPARVSFYPYNLTLTAPTVGTVVNVWDLGFDMSLTLPATNVGTVETLGTLQALSSSGDVFTTSIIAPQGESFPFGNYSSTSDALVSAAVNGSSVELNVTNFNISLPVPYESELNPNIDGLTYYRLRGNLVLRGVAGCDAPVCGPNGRCEASSDGVAACQCSCGWSGPSCNVSSGYCSQYTGASSTLLAQQRVDTAETPSGTTTPAPSTSPSVPQLTGLQPCIGSAGKTCSPLFETLDDSGRCACNDGFAGSKCEACETDAACASLYGVGELQSPARCGSSVLYSSNTTYKSYTCELDGTGLETTIVPGTFYVTCNTTASGGDGASCTVNFVMQEYADNPISCKASMCSFMANSSQVDCRSTSCVCDRDCPDLGGVFDSIEKRPAIISCDEGNMCTFDIENFFVKLVAPCRTTECQLQGHRFEDGTYRVTQNTSLDPVLAAIPLIVLVSVNASLLVFLVRNKGVYFSRSASGGSDGCDGSGPATVAAAKAATGGTSIRVERNVRCLSFRDVTVFLSDHGRCVLDGVSGEALVGQVTGIMGPSGSGKTTLISLLSQRANSVTSKSSGAVMLDDGRLDSSHTKIIGYCPQDSCLLPTLTVYESIMYSAILRLPRNTSVDAIHRITQESISKVRLEGVKSSYVGGSGRIRGISGGERRRVSVAMEIVTSPKIVLLDEPTSGLDSSSAKQVVSSLKSLASSGCIVMLSLHQPSPAMFNMLDKVFLLSAGRCLYSGPPSSASSYLNALGLHAPPGEGVAEYMLECASDPHIIEQLIIDSDRESLNGRKRPSGADETRGSKDERDKVSDDVLKDIEAFDATVTFATEVPSTSSKSSNHPSYMGASIATELATLTWRNGLDMARNPSLLVLHWLLALGMGIFAGCVFFQVGLDTAGAQNRAGGLIFALAFFAFTSLTTVDLVFHEKTIVDREVSSGYYRRWTYVVSKLVVDGLFLRFVPILLFSAPFYPMMGLDSDPSSVALFLMTLGTFAVTVGALSLAVTFLSSTAGQASFIMNLILLVCLLNSGFFVNADDMPDWISWLRYISVFFYGYSIMITNEVSDLLFQFVVEGYTAVENVRGITFLNILGIDPYQTTDYIIVLDCMYVIFCGLALLFSYAPISWIVQLSARLARRP